MVVCPSLGESARGIKRTLRGARRSVEDIDFPPVSPGAVSLLKGGELLPGVVNPSVILCHERIV
jgi:hypothetical protein